MQRKFGHWTLFLTSQVFVLGGAVLGALAFIYLIAPLTFGPLDHSPDSLAVALAFILCIVVTLLIGAIMGLFIWPLALRPFVTRQGFHGFVGGGPQLPIPGLSPAFRRLVQLVYGKGGKDKTGAGIL
jgi:ribose/xylose/arabinose/galactoside ABC-type transport system permease subunit